MAKIDLKTTEIVPGVLYPKLVHRFKVEFTDSHDTDLSILTEQVISVSSINRNKNSEYSSVSITVQDETTGELLKLLQNLMNDDTSFELTITHLRGNESVICSFNLTGCQLEDISYGALDYRGGGAKYPKLKLKTPFRGGDLIEAQKANPITEAITQMLNGMELTFEDGQTDHLNPCVEHSLYISFTGLEIVS